MVDKKRILKKGDKGKAICQECGIVEIIYVKKDLPFSDACGIIEDVLCGTCFKCGEVVSIPAQSTEQIKRSLQQYS